jgi:hypothetical protein
MDAERVQHHGRANRSLQCLLVDLLALVEVDGTPGVAGIPSPSERGGGLRCQLSSSTNARIAGSSAVFSVYGAALPNVASRGKINTLDDETHEIEELVPGEKSRDP